MQRTPLVVGGVLKGFLTDLRTSRKLGLPPTGNGLRLKRLVQTQGPREDPRARDHELGDGGRETSRAPSSSRG